MLASKSTAATLTWDPSTTGTGSYGSGTWDTSATSDWSTGTGDTTFGSGNTAVFGGTYTGTPATVTLGSAISALAINFVTTGYTIASTTATSGGNSLTLTSTASGTGAALYTNGTGVTETFSGYVVFAGNGLTNYMNIGAGDTVNFTVGFKQSSFGTSNFILSGGGTAGTGTVNYNGSNALAIGKLSITSGAVFNFNSSGGAILNNGSFVGVYDTSPTTAENTAFNIKAGTVNASALTLYIGKSGSSGGAGLFSISGGSASFSMLNVGNDSGGIGDSTGTVTVSGGTFTSSGNVTLGSTDAGVGTLNLNGGTFSTGGTFALGTGSTGTGGSGTINFNGGTLTMTATAGTTVIPATIATNVLAGGALISNANAETIASALVTGVTTGTDGGLTKSGAGTLTLTGTSTYSGSTKVSAGTLLVANNSAATGLVTVATGATLGGSGATSTTVVNNTGTIGGVTTVNGTITGATSTTIGMLTLSAAGTTTLNSGSIYLAVINSTISDNLKLSGALSIVSGANLTFNGTPAATSYDLANYTSETGTFTVTNLPSGYTLDYGATELDLVATPVPEPSTWAAGLLCCVMLGFTLRQHLSDLARSSLRSGRELMSGLTRKRTPVVDGRLL